MRSRREEMKATEMEELLNYESGGSGVKAVKCVRK